MIGPGDRLPPLAVTRPTPPGRGGMSSADAGLCSGADPSRRPVRATRPGCPPGRRGPASWPVTAATVSASSARLAARSTALRKSAVRATDQRAASRVWTTYPLERIVSRVRPRQLPVMIRAISGAPSNDLAVRTSARGLPAMASASSSANARQASTASSAPWVVRDHAPDIPAGSVLPGHSVTPIRPWSRPEVTAAMRIGSLSLVFTVDMDWLPSGHFPCMHCMHAEWGGVAARLEPSALSWESQDPAPPAFATDIAAGAWSLKPLTRRPRGAA